MTEKIQLILAVGLVGLLGGLLYVGGGMGYGSEKAGGNQSSWKERILSVGGMEAYAQLAAEIEGSSPADQHVQAHEFGAALYVAEGLAGLGVCDERFSYGCFHEFMGRAIAERGLESVPELNEGCVAALVKSPVSCQHGVGHGILAYLGYGETALRQALDECYRLPYNDPIGGCYGGVFMEYNMQTMLGTDARLRVPKEAAEVYEPCKSLPAEYSPACTFWQPQWWHQVLFSGADTEEAFDSMGMHCKRLAGSSVPLLRTCFEGIGNIVGPAAGFDASRAAVLCDASSQMPLDRLFCRSLAGNSLSVGGAGLEGNGEAICRGLSGEYLSYCLSYARNEANILRVLPPPTP